MALMVGIFETILFRGFIQGRPEASLGTAPAVFGAALLYGTYHIGYGMGQETTVFLAGVGIVYALAYATADKLPPHISVANAYRKLVRAAGRR